MYTYVEVCISNIFLETFRLHDIKKLQCATSLSSVCSMRGRERNRELSVTTSVKFERQMAENFEETLVEQGLIRKGLHCRPSLFSTYIYFFTSLSLYKHMLQSSFV